MLYRYKISKGLDGSNYMVFDNEYDMEQYRNTHMDEIGHLPIACFGGYDNAICMTERNTNNV